MTKLKGSISSSVSLTGVVSGETTVQGGMMSGSQGLSAYEVWLQNGYEGTVEDFLASLKSDKVATFIHPQLAPAETWEVYHGLRKYPSVTVVDSGGNVVLGDVTYINDISLVITFTSAFSGNAYIN